jgi:hypothetical protein
MKYHHTTDKGDSMKPYRSLITGVLGALLCAAPVLAQNIQTSTNSTTVGSQSFGFAITPQQLQTVMQSASPLNCGSGRSASGSMTCTTNNFSKAEGMPGSFTGNPFKIVWDQADFGCGAPCGTNGGADPQTAPAFSGPNTLAGVIRSDVNLGLGTLPTDAFHIEGHLRFTLDPSSKEASIDQAITQRITSPEGFIMDFATKDVAASFKAGTDSAIFSFSGPVNMTTGMTLSQKGELGPNAPGAFVLDVTTPFVYGVPFNASSAGASGSTFPFPEEFFTPGLNTQPDNPRTTDINESDLFPIIF